MLVLQKYPVQYIVRKVFDDFAVCDWWCICKTLGDVKFSQIDENVENLVIYS